jgi:putative SOS response-associated peptidase YedK
MSPASNLEPRYNICPTTTVDTIVAGDGQRVLVPMRWGIIPGWWTKPLKDMRLDVLQRWPVSKRVNSSRASDDDPTLIESVA